MSLMAESDRQCQPPDKLASENNKKKKPDSGAVIIDVVGEEEKKLCRICHMGSECIVECGDWIQLGCGCKNDLGTSHRNCAELWFATKGDRLCEICGAFAKNVSGVGGDNGLMLAWNNAPFSSLYFHTSSTERRYRPMCSFIGMIIILALVTHWLLHTRSHSL